MTSRLISRTLLPALAIASCCALPRVADAQSFAVLADQLPPDALGRVAAAAPDRFAAWRAIDDVVDARRTGVLTGVEADLQLADRIDELTDVEADWSAQAATMDAETYALVRLVDAIVVARPLRSILSRGEAHPALARATAELLAVTLDTQRDRFESEGAGPDRTCFSSYDDCMRFCSERDDFVGRSACGLDCFLDLSTCLSAVGGELIRPIVETIRSHSVATP